MPLAAQDQKKDPVKDDKKVDVKKDDVKKTDDKKTDVKKDDVKTVVGDKKKKTKDDGKKVDPKEVKKDEPAKVDASKAARDAALLDLKGHSNTVCSLEISGDAKQSLLGQSGSHGTHRNLADGKEVLILKDNPSETKSAVFLSADRIAGSTGKWNKEKKTWEGEIRIWDRSGKVMQSLKGHTQEIECLAVSKDGKLLASGSEDHTINVWDLAAGKEIMTIKAYQGRCARPGL